MQIEDALNGPRRRIRMANLACDAFVSNYVFVRDCAKRVVKRTGRSWLSINHWQVLAAMDHKEDSMEQRQNELC
jgi:hypothetical protein